MRRERPRRGLGAAAAARPRLELCLANPPYNGLTGPLLRAYLEALEDARLHDAVRAVVTTSAADVWCAGGDLGDLAAPRPHHLYHF